jgi:hypothetical protein
MVDSEDPTGHALELARSATPAMARRRTVVARRPPRSPGWCWWRSWAARGPGRPRSACTIAGGLAGREAPASAGVEVTTRQVTVVQHADTSVLVHRVETALVVRTLGVARGWPADDE